MQNSKLAKNILKYLPVLAVLVVTVMGLLVGRDLDATFLNFQSQTPTHLSAESHSPQPLSILGAEGPCGDLPQIYIYTSLPPKCRTFKGKFVPVPGIAPDILVTPEGK